MAKPVKSLTVCKRCPKFRQSYDPFKGIHSYQCLATGAMKQVEKLWRKYFTVPKDCRFITEHAVLGQYGGK